MIAEIIAVGTEILLGQVVNTNAKVIAENLAKQGIDVYYQIAVGDNVKRLTEAIVTAEKRSDLLILTGGLGSTDDDLTKQVLAQHLQEELVVDKEAQKNLQDYFSKTKRKLTKNNQRQVLVMKNAQPLANHVGLAVGSFLKKNGKYYAVLPGPPEEMQTMLVKELKPLLVKELAEQMAPLHTRVLRFFGLGEAELTAKIAQLIAKQTDPTIAPYAKPAEVTLRLATKGVDTTAAMKRLDFLEQEILATNNLREYFYGYGDDNSLAQETVALLKRNGKTVSAAESLTAGLFQATLGNISGASEVFKGGFVVYSLQTKVDFLDISEASLLDEGTVSEFTAKNMAESARIKAQADYALSFTGVAGPDKLEGQEIGTVWIGLAKKGEVPRAFLSHFSGLRQNIRLQAVMTGLNLLRKSLLKE